MASPEPIKVWDDATDASPASHRLVLLRSGVNKWTLERTEGADAMGVPQWVEQDLTWTVFAAILNRVIPAAQG